MNDATHPISNDEAPTSAPSSSPATTSTAELTDRALWFLGTTLAVVLLLGQAIDLLGYPEWSTWVYQLALLVEAGLPLGVSFFLKNAGKATLLRILGIVVLVLYLVTLF